MRWDLKTNRESPLGRNEELGEASETMITRAHFFASSSPFPPASEIELLHQTKPEYVERVFSYVEKYSGHQMGVDNRILDNDRAVIDNSHKEVMNKHSIEKRGQNVLVSVVLVLLAGSLIAGFNGLTELSIVIASLGGLTLFQNILKSVFPSKNKQKGTE